MKVEAVNADHNGTLRRFLRGSADLLSDMAFFKKISVARGLFSHDSHVMRAVTSSNSWYHLKVRNTLKVGSMARTDALQAEISQRKQAII